MSQNTAEITGEIAADTQMLAHLFGQLKASQVNLRKVELMQCLAVQGKYFLRLEMDVSESPQQIATLEQIRLQLK